MGMPVTVDVRDAGAGAEAAGRAFAWLRWVDATFSTYDPTSEISRLGRGELALREAHPLVRSVLARCERLRRRTGGYFDVRAAGALDPSGLVKGWAVQRAGRMLEAAGARHVFYSCACAIHILAPVCAHCGCKIMGHAIESNQTFSCCALGAHAQGATQVVDHV